MTAASLFKSPPPNGLQPVDLSRHLGGIADLIELVFRHELDAAGRGFLREMHWLSHAGPALRLMNGLLLGRQPWNLGFVWVENGRVVGSVSTQRAASRSRAWLVANVAVHPDYRRRGIAQALMRATLDLIRDRGGSEAILQVDDDNLGAIALYRGLGFSRVTTQTAWMRPAFLTAPAYQPAPVEVRLRAPGEWRAEYALAALVRPAGLAWTQPLRPEDFKPSRLKQLDGFISGRTQENWVAVEPNGRGGETLVGSLIVSPNRPDGDHLTLMVHPSLQGRLEHPLLLRGVRRLGRRPLPTHVEHDADDEAASQALRALGFQAKRVLRWMRCEIR